MTKASVIPIEQILSGQEGEAKLLYKLAALGSQTYFSGYNNSKLGEFDSLSFEVIANMWPDLSDSLKLRFISNHQNLFVEAIKNAG